MIVERIWTGRRRRRLHTDEFKADAVARQRHRSIHRLSLNRWTALGRFCLTARSAATTTTGKPAAPMGHGRQGMVIRGQRARGPACGHGDELGKVGQAARARPWLYLKDVLERLPTHPNRRIDELLPHRWLPDRALSDRPSSRCDDETLTQQQHVPSPHLRQSGRLGARPSIRRRSTCRRKAAMEPRDRMGLSRCAGADAGLPQHTTHTPSIRPPGPAAPRGRHERTLVALHAFTLSSQPRCDAIQQKSP